MDIDKLTTSIQVHEGLRLFPYQDATGHTTIGYGRNLSGNGISPAEADYLLSTDIKHAISAAHAETWWPVVADNDARSRAIIEIIFNMGANGVGTFKTAIAYLENADFNNAADAFLDSLWAKQTGQRAIDLTNMIRTGTDQQPTET